MKSNIVNIDILSTINQHGTGHTKRQHSVRSLGQVQWRSAGETGLCFTTSSLDHSKVVWVFLVVGALFALI